MNVICLRIHHAFCPGNGCVINHSDSEFISGNDHFNVMENCRYLRVKSQEGTLSSPLEILLLVCCFSLLFLPSKFSFTGSKSHMKVFEHFYIPFMNIIYVFVFVLFVARIQILS